VIQHLEKGVMFTDLPDTPFSHEFGVCADGNARVDGHALSEVQFVLTRKT
jgi:hypothetical protein